MSNIQLTSLTSYSLLQSTIKIPDYVSLAKQLGYQYLGITDRNNLYGALEFMQACQKENIYPVLGLLLEYFSEQTQKEHEIFLFAKNYQGYQQLIQLSSKKMLDDKVKLEDFTLSDLFAVLPLENELQVLFGQPDAKERLEQLSQLFSGDQLFYGVSYQQQVKEDFSLWLEKNQIKSAAYQLIDTLQEEEAFAVKVMQYIKNGEQLDNFQQALQTVSNAKSLTDPTEVKKWYETNYPDSLLQTEKIAQSCQFKIPLHQKLLPHYPLEEGLSAAAFLKELCETKLLKRIPSADAVYRKRLDYELEVIHRMGFDDYFLIVWDVMAFLHDKKIVTGAGRGSAAGSLTAYVLAITDVDPIKYDLLFERFLNPERNNMPDIDLDIPDNKRSEVLQYVKEKYGQNHVAQIATFGTMAAKMVLRDSCRVFGLSQSEVNRWSKAVPNQLKITLAEAYRTSKDLRELTHLNARNQQLFKVAKILEGLPRHVSTHAAGVVISDQDLLEIIPLQEGTEGIWLTQFTMHGVEETGLLKIDFLGLRNLAIIADTLEEIQRTKKFRLQPSEIPLDDPLTLQLFQRGTTAGVFQFESAGIRNVMRRLSPENIEDIAAVNALYRPGPMQNIDTFIKRKHGKAPIDSLDESLNDILANTYGVMVYQEQIMQVANKMAGFSLGQADILRRAISKKKKSVLDEQRQAFINGAKENGHSEQKANQVYDYIEKFADYGFNRSHAFAYSFVAFQMAYLKVHYPAPFFKAVLRSVQHNPKKMKEYLNDAKTAGIKILNPSINESFYSFSLQDEKTIRFGLGGIKGLRRDFIYDVLDDRREKGHYTSFDHFLSRINQKNSKWLKEEYLLPLIAIGAFDEITSNRRQILSQLDGSIQNVIYSGGSIDLLDMMELKTTTIKDYSLQEKLDLEEKYLGLYLSGHPTEQFKKLKQRKNIVMLSSIVENTNVQLLLYLTAIREIRTKKGEQMAFADGNDPTDSISVTIFPTLYRKVRKDLAENQVFYIQGKVERSNYNNQLQLIANDLAAAQKKEEQLSAMTCYLKISKTQSAALLLKQLYQIIAQFPGSVPVILFYEESHETKMLAENSCLQYTSAAAEKLVSVFGKENVVFK